MNWDTDDYDTQDEPYISKVPPITNNHVLLPLPGGRHAPRTLTSKGQEYELTHFLEVYNHLCVRHQITCNREKCRGIVLYCSPKIVRMIRRFPSYVTGDFNQLVQDLYYFLDDEDNTYNAGEVESFTRKWQKRKIESMKQFKRYHRKYLELVGQAMGSQNMTDRDFNRYFWEGIHHSLRRKIEYRMLIANPELDVSTPFEMSQVVKAVGSLLNQHRFDQHLFGKSSHDFSDSETDEESYQSRRPQSDSDDEKDSESDDSDHTRTPLSRKKRYVTDQKTSSKTDLHPKPDSYPQKHSDPRKTESQDISQLTQEIHQFNLTDPGFRAFYTDIIREVLDEQRPTPTITDSMTSQKHFQRDTPPHQEAPHSRTYIPPHQDTPAPRRHTPPPGQSPHTSDAFCHGCGLTGHRIAQCGEIHALINQRVIIRSSWGKLQWPDGSPIYKDIDELWVPAIEKAVKRTNLVRARSHSPVNGGVQQYTRVALRIGNASHEEQPGIGNASHEEQPGFGNASQEEQTGSSRHDGQLRIGNASHEEQPGIGNASHEEQPGSSRHAEQGGHGNASHQEQMRSSRHAEQGRQGNASHQEQIGSSQHDGQLRNGKASHEEWTELNWYARQTRDDHTGEAERNLRVSRDTRKQVQFSIASYIQEPRNLLERKNTAGPDRQRTLIDQEVDYNHGQLTTPRQTRPPDIHQNRFKTRRDVQSLSTEVDQRFIRRCRNEVRRIPTDQGRSDVTGPGNSRTRPEHNSTAVTQDIPKRSFSITSGESTDIPSARQRYPTSMLR